MINPKCYKAEYTGYLCARMTTAASAVGLLTKQFNNLNQLKILIITISSIEYTFSKFENFYMVTLQISWLFPPYCPPVTYPVSSLH
jgi:hypothetical protein